MTATAFLKASRLRAKLRRHPWVYGNSVTKVEGAYENGDEVTVRAPDGKFLAHGFINDDSRLRLRLVSFERLRTVDDALLRERVADAVRLRDEVLRLPDRTDAYRVIHSEADGLPGLIVDRFGPVLVLTCSSLGTFKRLEPILDELEARLSPVAIVEQGVSEGLRAKEGLPAGRGLLRGELPAEDPIVTIDGLRLRAPIQDGQKTALFVDQRDNVLRMAGLAKGKRVLDACCYTGTFGLACAKAGAESVLLFDSSADAVAGAEANAALNEVAVEVRRAQLYAELKRLDKAEQRFDMIVLDPPKFASTARDVPKARKGYFNANLMAVKLLEPGGLMLTCSCSGHVSVDLLEEVLREVSTRAGVDLRILERRGAGPDHPVDAHCPEGRYLKALLVQRRG